MNLRAGNAQDYSRDPEAWVFVDIGFGGRRANGSVGRSTGLFIPGVCEPVNVTWREAVEAVSVHTSRRAMPTNLMIEAPLSVAFDRNGNPAARAIERSGGKSRAWYLQSGLVTLVSAGMLLTKAIRSGSGEIRLFEALLSFKDGPTDHSDDTRQMMAAVASSSQSPLSAESLKDHPTDRLESSLAFSGLDFGIPPVFVIPPHL